jgi:hypothetical protein
MDKEGVSDDRVGWIFLPEVEGGKGKADPTTSELVAQHLARSRIVKTFNAILFTDLELDVLPRVFKHKPGDESLRARC